MKCSAGSTVNLNWPFLLSKRNRIDLDGAMVNVSKGYGSLNFGMNVENCTDSGTDQGSHRCIQYCSDFIEIIMKHEVFTEYLYQVRLCHYEFRHIIYPCPVSASTLSLTE